MRKRPEKITCRLTYNSWKAMKDRCKFKNNPFYKRYFDNNVTLCSEWASSFGKFLEDMGVRPSKEHTLDRIDNTKGYFKDNCRWATKKEQARNRSSNRMLSYNGISLCAKDWAEFLGVNYSALQSRLRRKWPTDRALSTPFEVYKKKGTH